MKLSIVTTLYKSERFVGPFIKIAIEAAEANYDEFELILVDDGSPDSSADIARSITEVDDRVILIELSRNFGHHAAALCAIEYASGDLIFLIDSDLEVDPRILSDFSTAMERTGADVVYGIQETRQGSFVARRLGEIFWSIFNAVSDVTVPKNVMTERLMTRRYVDALVQMGDRNLFMGGMFYWPGYSQVPLVIQKQSRLTESTYTFRKRAVLLVEAISSFSSVPLLSIFWVGIAIFAAAGTYSLFLVFSRLLFPSSIVFWGKPHGSWSYRSLRSSYFQAGTTSAEIHCKKQNGTKMISSNSENLDNYINAYSHDFPYHDDNIGVLRAYADKFVKSCANREKLKLCSLGIGYEVVSEFIGKTLARKIENYTIVEGSGAIIEKFKQSTSFEFPVDIAEAYFEDYTPESEGFDVIEMGFVLEHVSDPALIVKRFASFLKPGGVIIAAVPNARSLHRELGYRAGLLDDMYKLSKWDLELGHKRYFDMETFRAVFEDQGMVVHKEAGLMLKPFSTAQLNSLGLSKPVLEALYFAGDVSNKYSYSLYIEAGF